MRDEPTPSDIAFSDAVKRVQSRMGSRETYAELVRERPWPDRLSPWAEGFIAARTSVFLGTAGANGQPYIQHRGGPAGFLRVLDDRTVAFADLEGNQQYITLGNLSENPAAFLFLIDYERRRRIKIWGEARVIEGEAAELDGLRPDGGRAARGIVLTVRAWDVNCPRHIPQLVDAERVAEVLAEQEAKIAALEAELARLRSGSS
ncbi:pyridoxamine 5'-phosphate oxidase family protein [Celeribacter neptunius]|uniref:Pyridoxamine 5'-phosphate oxidase N-terminal domain-containing protein n=1 Tax=Celeribacter neptunius TaxID=588602 RepID=A0A1I3LWC0_9RHOB|nr:pyridoxamine 5'-phosphate oxidase family protein [Celeribacter neptunius]SFI89022.1 hypothetical protein SAMN04487991_1163 [Celeribacter neptunius]